MKPINKHALLSLAVMALVSTLLAFPACDDDGGKKKSKIDVNLTILQTTDMHNRVAGYGVHNDYSPDVLNNDDVVGGFARLATKTDQIRDAQTALTVPVPVLLLDSGDYTMGTVYDLLWDSDPAPFAYLQYMNYDATTLGNHEFDYNPQRLAAMINAAKLSTDPFTVPIVASNIIFSLFPDSWDLQPIEYGFNIPEIELLNDLQSQIIEVFIAICHSLNDPDFSIDPFGKTV